jgi:hypothetical protein
MPRRKNTLMRRYGHESHRSEVSRVRKISDTIIGMAFNSERRSTGKEQVRASAAHFINMLGSNG